MLQQEPAHGIVIFRTADGVDRQVETASFPLFAHTEDFVGSFSIMWPIEEDRRRGGRPGGAGVPFASPGQDTERYGGNTSCVELRAARLRRRRPWDAGTGIRDRSASRLVRRARAERMLTSCSPTCTSTISRASACSSRSGASRPSCTSGARLARRLARASGSRRTSPRRCSRCTCPRCRRRSSTTTRSESEWQIGSRRGSPRNAIIHPGPTVGYRHRVQGPRRSPTSPTTNPPWAPTSDATPSRAGSPGSRSPTAPTC